MLANGVQETTTTTGTGALTLSAVAGFVRFSDAFADGERCGYSIISDAGAPIEGGIGVYTAANTLARTYPLWTYASGTYDATAPAAVSLSSGTKTVLCSPLAELSGLPSFAPQSGAAFRGLFSAHLRNSAGDSKSCAANTAFYTPFLLLQSIQLASLACRVETGGASSNVRLGLWSWNPDGTLGPKVTETADVATTTSGIKTGSVTARRLCAGWYLTGLAVKTSAVTMSAYAAGSPGVERAASPLGLDTTGYGYGSAQEALGAFTDLPAVPNLGSKVSIVAEYPPRVFLVPA